MELDIIKKIIECHKGQYVNLNNIEKNYLKEQYKKHFHETLNTACGSCLMNAVNKVAPLLKYTEPEKAKAPTIDLEAMTIKELQELCKTFDLPIRGNKAKLIERLKEVV